MVSPPSSAWAWHSRPQLLTDAPIIHNFQLRGAMAGSPDLPPDSTTRPASTPSPPSLPQS